MDYLPYFLKRYNLDLQPSHSDCIDVQLAKSVLYAGAHIATSNPYEHYHHGIVVDTDAPDISIIHLWGPEKDSNRVQTTTLPVFLAGDARNVGKRTRRLYLVHYENDTLEKQQQTVRVAKEMLERADEIVYDLATLNCESFACFCRTNTWHSEQVERIKLLMEEKAAEIYEQLKDADDKNKANISSILKVLPSNALNPSEKELYDQLCQHDTFESL